MFRIGLFSNPYVYFGIAPIVVALVGLPAITLEKWFWRRRRIAGQN